MTFKDMERLGILREKIRRKIERRDFLWSKAFPSAIKYKPDKLSTPTVFDPLGDVIAEVWDVEQELNALQDEYYDTRKRICNSIRTLTDETAAAILCQRYIHFKTWNDIEERVKCGHRTALRKHNEAISEKLSTTKC